MVDCTLLVLRVSSRKNSSYINERVWRCTLVLSILSVVSVGHFGLMNKSLELVYKVSKK